jgi:hypothetical protein
MAEPCGSAQFRFVKGSKNKKKRNRFAIPFLFVGETDD